MQVTRTLRGSATISAVLFLLPLGCDEAPLPSDADAMPDATFGGDAVIDSDAASDAARPPDGNGNPVPDAMDDAASALPGEGACRFDPNLPWDSLGEILQLQSPRNGTCVWLSRRNECPPDGICKAVPFTLEHLRVGHDGSVVEIDDPDALSWESTHHNWCDVGEGRTAATRFRLEVQVTEQFRYLYLLTALDRDTGAARWSEWLQPFQASGRRVELPAADIEVLTCDAAF